MLFLFYSRDLVKEMDKQARNGTLINKARIHPNIHQPHRNTRSIPQHLPLPPPGQAGAAPAPHISHQALCRGCSPTGAPPEPPGFTESPPEGGDPSAAEPQPELGLSPPRQGSERRLSPRADPRPPPPRVSAGSRSLTRAGTSCKLGQSFANWDNPRFALGSGFQGHTRGRAR